MVRFMDAQNGDRSASSQKSWHFTYVGGDYDIADDVSVFNSGVDSVSVSQVRLSDAAIGDVLEVVGCHGGNEFARNLAKLGVSVGSVIEVISRTRRGAMMVVVNGEQLGFGLDAATQICGVVRAHIQK